MGHHKNAHIAGAAAAVVFAFTRGRQLSILPIGCFFNSNLALSMSHDGVVVIPIRLVYSTSSNVSGQIVHTQMPLLSRSMHGYWSKDGDVPCGWAGNCSLVQCNGSLLLGSSTMLPVENL